MKNPNLIDFRGVAGRMLRGNPVYNGNSRAPNPTGRNQYQAAAKLKLRNMKRKREVKNSAT